MVACTHLFVDLLITIFAFDLLRLFSHSYSQDEYAKVSLRTWVNVVYGHMTSIDRKKKMVIVDGNFQVCAVESYVTHFNKWNEGAYLLL